MCVSKELCESFRRDIPEIKNKVDKQEINTARLVEKLSNLTDAIKMLNNRLERIESAPRHILINSIIAVISSVLTLTITLILGG